MGRLLGGLARWRASRNGGAVQPQQRREILEPLRGLSFFSAAPPSVLSPVTPIHPEAIPYSFSPF